MAGDQWLAEKLTGLQEPQLTHSHWVSGNSSQAKAGGQACRGSQGPCGGAWPGTHGIHIKRAGNKPPPPPGLVGVYAKGIPRALLWKGAGEPPLYRNLKHLCDWLRPAQI